MKQITLIATALVFPFMLQAQDIGLAENYKTKKQKRLAAFKPHQKSNLTVTAGFSSVSRAYGLMYNFGAEYMFNEKLGIRGNFTSNNLSGSLQSWGTHSYGVDLSYHFIQSKRWDVYAFAGLGYQRHNYLIYNPRTSERQISYGNLFVNAGVGARYKIKPNFGMQLELGRTSNFALFKTFNLGSAKK